MPRDKLTTSQKVAIMAACIALVPHEQTAATFGCTEARVRDLNQTSKRVGHDDVDFFAEQRGKPYLLDDIKAACLFFGLDADAFLDRIKKRAAENYKQKQAERKAATNDTIKPSEETTDKVYFIRILEELARMNENLCQLMDAVLPHHTEEIIDAIGISKKGNEQ